jgi:formylmethanofuran dehydrogenase subunit E
MMFRPAIPDPTDTGTLDGRVRCDICGRDGTEEEPLEVLSEGEALCADCLVDNELSL